MTLVIGDGIQQGSEALTGFLQLHAGPRVGIALVDQSIRHGVNGGRVITPAYPVENCYC
jgi:hypothetical protein